ncbi:MAG: hypothetical protein IKB82_02545 [Clostridia bacterium]|nr:hypothetical protein [Clostridia bacterium]
MKCKFTEKKNMKIMLIAGLVLMALGAVIAYLLPEEMHLATRIAGFVSGVGSSLALLAGVILLRRWHLGEARARDAELAMNDERGIAVAYKAQSVAAIAGVAALIILSVSALVRGDQFYMLMGAFLMCGVALAKLLAWHIYNKTM